MIFAARFITAKYYLKYFFQYSICKFVVLTIMYFDSLVLDQHAAFLILQQRPFSLHPGRALTLFRLFNGYYSLMSIGNGFYKILIEFEVFTYFIFLKKLCYLGFTLHCVKLWNLRSVRCQSDACEAPLCSLLDSPTTSVAANASESWLRTLEYQHYGRFLLPRR